MIRMPSRGSRRPLKINRDFTLQFKNEPWTGVFDGLTKLTGYPSCTRQADRHVHIRVADGQERRRRKYTLADMIDIINEGLVQQQFLLVRRRERFVVIPADEKIDLTYFEHVPLSELEQRGKTELVTYVVHLKHVRGTDARAALLKLLSPIGMATTVPGGGVSISDKAENVRKVVQVLTDLDQRGSGTANRGGGQRPGLGSTAVAPRKSDEREYSLSKSKISHGTRFSIGSQSSSICRLSRIRSLPARSHLCRRW